jgi:hypothetical protein
MPDELDLFVTLNLARTARLHASEAAIDKGIATRAALRGVTALVTGDSLAYRMRRTNESSSEQESGVIAHGPHARELTGQYAEVLLHWAKTTAGAVTPPSATSQQAPGQLNCVRGCQGGCLSAAEQQAGLVEVLADPVGLATTAGLAAGRRSRRALRSRPLPR